MVDFYGKNTWIKPYDILSTLIFSSMQPPLFCAHTKPFDILSTLIFSSMQPPLFCAHTDNNINASILCSQRMYSELQKDSFKVYDINR